VLIYSVPELHVIVVVVVVVAAAVVVAAVVAVGRSRRTYV